jgi:hypothetical protein
MPRLNMPRLRGGGLIKGGDDDSNDYTKPIRQESNVLVPVRLNELKVLSHINIFLALASIVYFGVNVGCTVLNTYDLEPVNCEHDLEPGWTEEECEEAQPITSVETFHKIEFGTTFLFSIIESLSIVYSPDRQFESPMLLKALIFWNIAVSFVPALLVFINIEEFEVPSHELEYTNGVCMALVDMLMAVQLINAMKRRRSHATGEAEGGNMAKLGPLCTAFLLGFIPVSIAVAQLWVYNGMGMDEDGERLGEKPAHFLEFAFEMVSSAITFWFCMDNKLRVDTMRLDIMLAGQDTEVVLVDHRQGQGGVDHVPQFVRKTELESSYAAPRP